MQDLFYSRSVDLPKMVMFIQLILIMVIGQFRKLDYGSLWEMLLTKVPYKDNFKDVLQLVELVLVLPISATQCERPVSAQNQIKSSTRATLSVSVLEELIRLSSEGPPVAEFF